MYFQALRFELPVGFTCFFVQDHVSAHIGVATISRLLKLKRLFAKEPYKRDDILQKRPIIFRSLLSVATPYVHILHMLHTYVHVFRRLFYRALLQKRPIV